MDPVTHTLTGAALGSAGLKKRSPLAMAAVLLAANAPDIDVFAYAWGPYAALAFRRGWTHGPLAWLVLPALVTLFLLGWDRWIRRRRRPDADPVDPRALYVVSLIGVLSHPVLDWLNSHDASLLFISSVTIGEIEYGIRILPAGRRRSTLSDRFENFVGQAFEDRVCSFDEAAARSYAAIMAHRREAGRPMGVPDGQIAAIGRSRGYAIATRNVGDLENCGLSLVNPFDT